MINNIELNASLVHCTEIVLPLYDVIQNTLQTQLLWQITFPC